MLHVVPAKQDKLALAVEVVDVDDAEPRLPGAAPVLAGQQQPPAGQPPQHEPEQGHQHEDDDEGDDVLSGLRSFDAKSGQHDELSRCAGPQRAAARVFCNMPPLGARNLLYGSLTDYPR
jgi:hypothetical protein